MLKYAEGRVKARFWMICIALLGVGSLCFKAAMDSEQWMYWSNKCLQESFNTDMDQRLKKWELNVTYDNFVRLRKTYLNGKQEYYSFHLSRFKDMDYLGTTASGTIRLKTIADDIIMQTYEDPKGNIDSMATSLNLNVKNITPERLDSLREALLLLKDKK